MLGVRQHFANRRWIAGQLVGDHHARLKADTVNNLPKEAFGGLLITSRLHEDVEHDAVLIDRPPEPVAFTVDLEQHLVQMPLVAGRTRRRRSPAAKVAPNLVHHSRTVSWLTMRPRSASRS